MSEADGRADADVDGFHRAVLDGLPEAVIVAADDGVITFANAGAERLFGYGAAEMVGRPITALAPREPGRRADPVQWLARWAAEANDEHLRFVDLKARRKDGAPIILEVRVRGGRVGGRARYFITLRDKSRSRAEQIALKDANLRAARILMLADDAIVSVDADQKIVFFNPAAERLFGYSAEEAQGQPLSMLLPPEARAPHAALVDGFAASRQASRMMGDRPQVRGLRRSGESFPLEATITKVMAAGVLTYTAQLRDVTERNRARAALEERERRIRAVFDHAGEAIALLSRDGDIVEMNSLAVGLTTAGGPSIGAPLWAAPWLGVDLAADPAAAEPLKAAMAVAAGGHPARLSVELWRDGQPLPVDVRLTPIPGPDGGVGYILAEGRFED